MTDSSSSEVELQGLRSPYANAARGNHPGPKEQALLPDLISRGGPEGIAGGSGEQG
jgi:hypothetical protein